MTIPIGLSARFGVDSECQAWGHGGKFAVSDGGAIEGCDASSYGGSSGGPWNS